MTPSALKTELVQLRLTPQEKEALAALAEKQRMSVSGYLRWLIHKESEKK